MITCVHADCRALNHGAVEYCAHCGRPLRMTDPEHNELATVEALPVPLARPVMTNYVPFVSGPPVHPILMPDMTRGGAWVDLVLAVVLVIGWDLVVGVVLHAWLYATGAAPPDGEWTSEIQQQVLVPGLLLRAAGISTLVWLVVWRRGQSAASIGVTRQGWAPDVLIGVTALFAIYAIIFIFVPVVAVLWPEVLKQLQRNAELLQDIVPPLSPLAFLPLAFLIGVYEEILFRGFLMTRLRKATGSWIAAALLSTLVFTLLHAGDQTGAALLLILLLSIVFSIMTIWRRSILPAIVAHALFNYSQFLLLSLQER